MKTIKSLKYKGVLISRHVIYKKKINETGFQSNPSYFMDLALSDLQKLKKHFKCNRYLTNNECAIQE